jgi:hypothetical protein
MISIRNKQDLAYGLLLAVAGLFAVNALAQEDAESEEASEEPIMEEIVVYGGERQEPIDLDALYEDMLKETLLFDRDQLRILEEQNEWRSSDTLVVEDESRISWGYDPKEELRMRRLSNMDDLTYVPTKPAALFKVDF